MWSIGVIVYLLLVGYLPIMKDTQAELFSAIRAGKWKFQKEDWQYISTDAQDFIKKCLDVDPEQRWTAGEALKSAWICSSGQDPDLGDIAKTSLDELRRRRSELRLFTTPVIWESKESVGGDKSEEEGE